MKDKMFIIGEKGKRERGEERSEREKEGGR